jgi:mannosylglycerate hydrolase
MKLALPLARLSAFQTLAMRRKQARPPYKIENEYFVVEVNKNGTLSLLDKRNRNAYSGLNCFQDGSDCGDEYNYAPPVHDQVIAAALTRVYKVKGEVRQSLEVKLKLTMPEGLSQDRQRRGGRNVTVSIRSIITLAKGVPRVDIRTTVDNTARDHRLRVHFPAPFAIEKGSSDGHFEVVQRMLGLPKTDDSWIEEPRPEAPQRAFTDISDGQMGLMVSNRGLPEVEVLRNAAGSGEIALTLLRCVGWLSRDDFSTRKGQAGPMLETPAAQMPGEWTFDYSIIPHAGDWHEAYPDAYAFQTPMRAVNTNIHEGTLPPEATLVAVEPRAFTVSTLKRSEDLRGWLVRGYNLTGDDLDVTIRPWIPFKHVEKVDLGEQKLGSLTPAKDGSVFLHVRGHEIVSVLFRD